MIKCLNIKKYSKVFLFLFILLSLILFSDANLNASKIGLKLWVNNIVPSLFPFFIATELLLCTDFVPICGKLFNKYMRPLFNVPGEAFTALFLGIVSGYPVGAKIVCSLKENGTCSQDECERLLAFTNNSGPLFIVGTVGTFILGNSKLGLILLFIHIISSLIVGLIFKFWKYNKTLYTRNYTQNIDFNYEKNLKSKYYNRTSRIYRKNNYRHTIDSQESKKNNDDSELSLKNIGSILSNAIQKSINTILIIGGFIVSFSVLISIIYQTRILNIFDIFPYEISSFIKALFIGFIELTNGVYEVSKLSLTTSSICLLSFLLGFGGISVLFQVYSVIYKYNLSIKTYFIGKLLQGIIASIITAFIFYSKIYFL